jgi:serine/threonine protein kinase
MNREVEQAGIDCLSDQVLRDFNSGRLAAAIDEQVAAHLGSCESCESRLLMLPQGSIIELLRDPDPLVPLIKDGRINAEQSLASTKSRLFGELVSDTTEFRSEASNDEKLPVKIDQYFVVRELGRGAFGWVFLANDPDHQRLVAIKVPRPDRFATKASRDAFLKEARTVAVLDHPNIVPLYDCRELEDGRCIVVMKYIEGRTLRQAMATERSSHGDSAELVAKIADALHVAHQRGIWHRDVKPGNILLDQDGTPYLADFGLAIHEDQQHRHGNERAGTYPYMSPEQIRGSAKYLDGRSDIWSLGVVLYELLTRHRPFAGANLRQLGDAIQSRPHRPIRSHDPNISAALEAICDRCLQKDVRQRYSTAGELAADVTALSRRLSRKVVRLVAATMIVCVLVSAAGFVVSGWPRDSNEWQPLLHRVPEEVAWLNLPTKPGEVPRNDYEPDIVNGRLWMRHKVDRGLLSVHQPESPSFIVRFTVASETWPQAAGFFWGLRHTDADLHRCIGVTVQELDGEEQFRVRLTEFRLTPSSFDRKRLSCRSSSQIHSTDVRIPKTDAARNLELRMEISVSVGEVAYISLNEQRFEVGEDLPFWAGRTPAHCGFLIHDGEAIISDAHLLTQEELP